MEVIETTDAFKALIADYEKGDWDAFKGHYAENAAIYRNSTDSVSPQRSLQEAASFCGEY